VPDTLDRLFDVRAAVPLTPEPETSCCVRLMERADVPAQDEARTWLTFLRGLDLVSETDRGYVRTRDAVVDPADATDDRDGATLGERFLAGTYGARELRETLASAGSLDADAAFERFREHVPQYERHRAEDWEDVWRMRVRRLLSWGVLFGVFESDGGGYRVG
jgi:hypothetical protein